MIQPEADFEGFMNAMAQAAQREYEAIPAKLRATVLIARSAQRLHRLIELNAPAVIIEAEKRILQRRVAALPVYIKDEAQ